MKDPIKILHDSTSISLNEQMAFGYAMPPILPFKTIVRVPENPTYDDEEESTISPELQSAINKGLLYPGSTLWQVPVEFKISTDVRGYLLPFDPLISISGKNIITRRSVAKSKMRGTIKERWAQDDYTITITGVVIADEDYGESIEEHLANIKRYCEAPESVSITSDFLLDTFGIQKIAIESYDFPFTKGRQNQMYTIKGYSDDNYTLLTAL